MRAIFELGRLEAQSQLTFLLARQQPNVTESPHVCVQSARRRAAFALRRSLSLRVRRSACAAELEFHETTGTRTGSAGAPFLMQSWEAAFVCGGCGGIRHRR